ncbi:putative leucine-rich repeat receptor-like serine/threonine-protein kinase At2g24130 [Impatiens glandulifera]|uniref:putative leucine-rich repeat receptor-like serine/threonine-protein kinase At2g24130 n=1 Tax=Impatiens glandulifera TaxID=253017 RepID=UPI001FB09F37|nr:putative leucine-rich repeat receptor-like serine/threonine-protein kinase At2g24130 [Impatiens glandulifera]
MGICKFSKFTFLFLSIILPFNITKAQNTPVLDHDDRASLLTFMSGIISDPQNSLNNWNNSSQIHFCNWVGIKCDNNRVTELVLTSKSLTGIISPSIADLSSLTILDLTGNFFHGSIPPEIGSLSSLTQLSLSSNLLQGQIPSQLGNLHQLVYLSLGSNNLTGEIPKALFCNGSSYFQYIDFSNNTLHGEIPLNNQCYLKQLRFLLLWSNHLTGQIPKSLSNSSYLKWLDLESNFLSGELPAEVVNHMPHLQFLYLSYNNFVSHKENTDLEPFFLSLKNCSNLQELELAGNNLRGEIPPIIGSLSSSNLKEIHLHDNLLHGPIPPQISNLFNLSLLNLSNNFLNGSIPSDLSRMKKLERLYLSNNSLSGEIPASLGEIHHLGLLDLSKNMLTGQIPDSFVNVSQLRSLLLHENRLSGTIPLSLGNCINLEILDLSHNRISGQILREVVLGLTSLKMYLNLSNNQLEGTIPLELSKMDMVLSIDLSFNRLSKTIPPQLSSCIALETLNLSNNMLEGSLPDSIGKLTYLKELDVSSNQLTGEIPSFIRSDDNSFALTRLNLSFNDFHGNVSNKGRFSIESFIGNPRLCGSIEGMRGCRNRKKTHHVLVLPVIISLVCMLILCLLVGYYLSLKAKFKRQVFDEEEKEREQIEHKYPRISRRQLIEATDGFSGSSLVGSGSYGHVYKGTLKDNTKIAVKVLSSNTTGEISGSFERECQVLKRTRHRNLIRILTICSRPDFKALVFPLMSNGSLEDHLYAKTEDGLGQRLDLAQLVSICSDVSEGLAYLHHHSPVRVVHCDLKPSNILLDDELTALVTDFGIARLVKGEEDEDNNVNSSDGLLCGTVGYIAPEYGVGCKASIQGDVYSFGILVLEIITGKRPTDVIFQQGSTLHDWVQSRYSDKDKVEPLMKEVLERCRPHPNQAYDVRVWSEVVIELIELGLVCTQYSSLTRPSMLDVAQEMLHLKLYLSTPSTLVI